MFIQLFEYLTIESFEGFVHISNAEFGQTILILNFEKIMSVFGFAV